MVRVTHRYRRLSASAVCLSAGLGIAACGSTATVEPAENAADPVCAEVMLALPEAIGEFEQRDTDSQATAVWGEPAHVVLRCGVPEPGPSTEHCVTADGVDWLAIEEGENWRLTSYGRSPAIEVLIDVEEVASSTVMVSLASAAERVEQTRECTTVEQAIEDTEDEVDVSGEATED